VLSIGVRVGPYEITGVLGAGGMGEVYRAHDTRLDRTVAIKVLPAHVAHDPDVRERFEREARMLAALSHPHICPVFDVGRQEPSDGSGPAIDFLVMEFLEGETLADRLVRIAGSKDPALPIDQVLHLGIQIADALDKAHRKGIVHRDLKPGNIMLTKAGAKLLDFGLAKVLPTEGAVGGLSIAATVTRPLTGHGTLLGTLHYMAPEQLEGREADARCDLFAFGAILHEMATGQKAFDGKSAASVIASILEREPPAVSALQPLTPRALDHLVKQCLAKDPDERWQTAGDVMRQLKWIANTASDSSEHLPLPTRKATRERTTWIALTSLLALVSAGLAIWAFRAPAQAVELHLDIVTPPANFGQSVAVSPEGKQIVFEAISEGRSHLWLRELNDGSARLLPRTEGASLPCWSADSGSIAFFADGVLKRLDLATGTARDLATLRTDRGAQVPGGCTWNREGVILFAFANGWPILRISAAGGEPVDATRVETVPAVGIRGGHRSPRFLPDGRHFMYLSRGQGTYIGELDSLGARLLLDTEADRAAERGTVFAADHLLFIRQGTLLAQRFDPSRLALSGEAFPLAEEVTMVDAAASSAGEVGPIVFRAGTLIRRRQFAWVSRDGRENVRVGPPYTADNGNPAMSPNGRFVAVAQTVGGAPSELWMLDTLRGLFTRFTDDPFINNAPVFSPDGSHLVYQTNPKGPLDIYQHAMAGGPGEPMVTSERNKMPTDWSRDGKYLLYKSAEVATRWDLFVTATTGTRESRAVVQSKGDDVDGQFSPDGRFIAYQSDDSGVYEIYIQPFPGPGQRVQVSTNGGSQVRWRRDGRELYYVALDERLMAVPIAPSRDGQSVEPGVAVPLFQTRVGGAVNPLSRQQYMVSENGQRFLMNSIADDTTRPITVILNWNPGDAR